MTADAYLQSILLREAVDTGPLSPVLRVQAAIRPVLQAWGGRRIRSIAPSGSFTKGTANHSGTDIDLFISLVPETQESLKDIHATLAKALLSGGYAPNPQNVSLNVTINGHKVDLVPGKQQNALTEDHSLYKRRGDTWIKTNVTTHIARVRGGQCQREIRLLKLWRDQQALVCPSFYLELTVMDALRGVAGGLGDRVWKVFGHLRDSFATARVVDPANTNNVISDDLTVAERHAVANAARAALGQKHWENIIR